MKWTELRERNFAKQSLWWVVSCVDCGVGGAASVHGRSLDDSSTRRGMFSCNRFRRCGLLREIGAGKDSQHFWKEKACLMMARLS